MGFLNISGDDFRDRARKINILVMDVDGVLTGGEIILDKQGNELKMFHVRDGHGIKMLQRTGVKTAIITGRSSSVVSIRADELGIEDVFQGAKEKLPAFAELLERHGFKEEEAAYIGDDIVDLPVMRRAGLSFTVADAEQYAKEAAHFVAGRNGGRGAVREVIDLLLKARGEWETVTAKYFG